MKIIELLEDNMMDELRDAQKYAELANKYKESMPNLAKVFYELSLEEMGHKERLHDAATFEVEKHRREHGEPPEGMLAIYNYLHDQHIKWGAKIKALQSMYSGK